jgi:uncharacterized alkaline shock family protein YloU
VTRSPASPTATATTRPFSLQAEAEAEAVAVAVQACPAVVDLTGGSFGEVATYLPGRRITGVRLTDDRIDVHLIGRYGVPVPILAAQVRTALTHLSRGRAIDIRVEDLGMIPQPSS